MQDVGWLIWGVAGALLLNSLIGLRKKKKREARIFFCLCTATGLVVTAVTPFSKFHLLWIMSLRLILGLLVMGGMAGIGWTYYMIKRRKPKNSVLPPGGFPPFGELKWDDDEWEGKIQLPAWAGFQSRRGTYGARNSESPSDGSVTVDVTPAKAAAELTPSEAQCRAMKFQIEHGPEVVQAVLAALILYHGQMKKNSEMNDKEMPPILEPEGFRKRIGLSIVHVMPHVADGVAYIGLELGCEWEEEHGLGIVLHKDRVIKIGEASDAINWQPPETSAAAK